MFFFPSVERLLRNGENVIPDPSIRLRVNSAMNHIVLILQYLRFLGFPRNDMDVKPPRLFAGNRGPGFKARMQLKDLRIIMETAREYEILLPTTAENAKVYEAMIEMGMGELDNSAVLGVLEKMAGVSLLDEA